MLLVMLEISKEFIFWRALLRVIVLSFELKKISVEPSLVISE